MSSSVLTRPTFQGTTSNVTNPDSSPISSKLVTGMVVTDSSMMFRNKIINGSMTIDQRNSGASINVGLGTVYGVDRWYVDGTTGSKMNMQRSTNAPAGFTNSLLITSTTALSIPASDRYSVGQRIEGFNLSDFAWGTASAQSITISFWVRSSLTGTFGAALRKAGGAYGYAFTYSISAANTWEYKTVVIAGPTSETWMNDSNSMVSIEFSLAAGASRSVTPGSWVAGDFVSATGATSVLATNGATWQVTGVQLEAGPTATPFERRPYSVEESLCFRYYQRLTNGSLGIPYSVNNISFRLPLTVPLRSAVTGNQIIGSSLANCIEKIGITVVTPTSITFSNANKMLVQVDFLLTSGFTVGQPCALNSGNLIEVSAEL